MWVMSVLFIMLIWRHWLCWIKSKMMIVIVGRMRDVFVGFVGCIISIILYIFYIYFIGI